MHELLIHRLDPDLPLPRTEYPGDAGLDLRARADVQIEPGQRLRIPTGIAIALPPGFVGLIHPRSGMATKFGFTLLNAPGTIDAGFRGEISVIGHNTDPITVISISRGDRIAQLVIQEIPEIRIVEVEQLPGSVRSEQGFGSSG
ncbi:MAG: dUTP diphosphatase [Candidatus Nanopelagicales bacterium]|jgi:dUTP pyrophosphatase|nr:dUTP diphosphatase [Candidatus Nanopelagicales bacterium]